MRIVSRAVHLGSDHSEPHWTVMGITIPDGALGKYAELRRHWRGLPQDLLDVTSELVVREKTSDVKLITSLDALLDDMEEEQLEELNGSLADSEFITMPRPWGSDTLRNAHIVSRMPALEQVVFSRHGISWRVYVEHAGVFDSEIVSLSELGELHSKWVADLAHGREAVV